MTYVNGVLGILTHACRRQRMEGNAKSTELCRPTRILNIGANRCIFQLPKRQLLCSGFDLGSAERKVETNSLGYGWCFSKKISVGWRALGLSYLHICIFDNTRATRWFRQTAGRDVVHVEDARLVDSSDARGVVVVCTFKLNCKIICQSMEEEEPKEADHQFKATTSRKEPKFDEIRRVIFSWK